MADARLRVCTRDLLYRTRGRGWDYSFLLQPEPLVGEGWYAIHRRIFAQLEPAPRPLLLRGTLGVGRGHPFLATTFTDARRRDVQGREVAHYLVWLEPRAETLANVNFGPPLVEALSPALESVFEVDPRSLSHEDHPPMDSLLRRQFTQLVATELTLDVSLEADVRHLGTIAA